MIDQAERLRNIIRQRNASVSSEGALTSGALNCRVIAVTSGKGGVGKTNFTVNLGIALRKQGKRVSIIDADFGLANVEVLFGMMPRFSLGDVLLGARTMEEVVSEGPLGIKLISGGSGLTELANISERQMAYILENISFLDSLSDIILIDTGAGISRSVINLIKASNETIIISTPEPTSVTDAYTIIKTIKEEATKLPDIKLVVNRVDDEKEGEEIFGKLHAVSQKFLNLRLGKLGYIPQDNSLIKAVKKQEPVMLLFPDAQSSKAITNISYRLLDMPVKELKKSSGLMGLIKRLVNN